MNKLIKVILINGVIIAVSLSIIMLMNSFRKGESSNKTNTTIKNSIEALKQKNGPKTLDIKLYSADGFAIIEFTNNGPQIENKALDKIFENLYTTKEKAAGLGLGIVKNVVDAHRAKIQVDSSAKETCFKIHLKK